MLTTEMKRDLPAGFRFQETRWYQAIVETRESYSRQLILTGLLSGAAVPLVYIFIDLLRGETAYLPNYLIPLALLLLMLVHLRRGKNAGRLSNLIILTCIVGFALTVYLPNSRDIYLLIFVCFPPFALQLTGIRRGGLWTILFLATAAAAIGLHATGLINGWNLTLTARQMVIATAAFTLLFIICLAGERQSQKHIGQLIRKLSFDEVTGLPNREVLLHSIHDGRDYLFAIIHVANFNDLGTIFGYDLSDEIMRLISKYLQQWSRTFDYSLYRLRGNEFGLLLPGDLTGNAGAETRLTRICAALRREFTAPGKLNIRLHIHLGAVLVDDASRTDFLSRADLALQDGIRSQRAVNLFTGGESARDSARNKLQLYNLLAGNLESGTCQALFQPIVDSGSGETVWFESLLRLRGSGGELLSPVPFLDLAVSTGLDHDITDFMLREASAAMRRTSCDISLNLGFRDLLRPEFTDLLFTLCQRSPDFGRRLILEIVERDELIENKTCLSFLEKARTHGCRIAVDDFGAGYSNLSRLIQLPMDILKIDGSLTQRCLHDRRARQLVQGIIAFCQANRVRVVAEYVDRPEVAELMARYGVHYLQGFHFGRPAQIPS